MNVSTLNKPRHSHCQEEPDAGNYFVAAYPPFSAWTPQGVGALHSTLEHPRTDPVGLYIHLPFCPKKCDYCYYLSYIAQSADIVNRYLDSVVKELQLYAALPGIQKRPVNFAYFGGGTPSTLSTTQLERLTNGLRDVLPWNEIQEITYECAPRSVRPSFLESLLAAGVTRLSMGVQSFDDALLKINGRVHLSNDVVMAVDAIQEAGFQTLNLDLMCGLIGETEASWKQSIERMIELSPDSITMYQMEIPFNTKLYSDLQAGTLPHPPVTWEQKRERLAYGFETLEKAGYTVVSAYNAVRDPASHPFRYQDHLWGGDDMLGLGVAAFGYVNGVHSQNEVSLSDYQTAVESGRIPAKRALALSHRDQLIREFVLQLKTGTVNTGYFSNRFNVSVERVLAEPLSRLTEQEYLTVEPPQIRLTREGLLRIDRLLPYFYDSAYQSKRYT
ncbi:MAG: coproporphyrinogen III oxidase family protein [Verrucomicrobia bacterium]|jgi:oxygen-independent coproporphyrinogen III oxidase|nr:coproporphyrinogen III oxidase family protein [Verrucomicrobiota bacterium]